MVKINGTIGLLGTVWHKHAPDFGRRGPEDIMRQQPGVTHQAQCNTIGQAFSLFITPEMIDLLVLETNREARHKITDWNNDNPENQKQPWIRLDSTEMKAFIGLFLLAGVYKSNHEPVKSPWSSSEGLPVFTAAMSRNIFTEIQKYLHFDNRATRAHRQATDKLAAFRDFWMLFQAQLPKYYIPGTDSCVDEQLVAFRGRCSFKQDIPSKPAKYGLKRWWCCDAQTSYPLKGDIYLGRQPGEQREIGQGARVVKELVGHWYRSGRNITADNFFSSIPLDEELLQKGLTYVCTIRSNKPEIPDEMRPAKNKDQHSSIFGFKTKVTLVSYVPRQNKAVLAISTMHHDDNVEGDNQKPEIILHYNDTKSGVDNLDHLATLYTSRRKVNRWPVVLFGNCLDVGAVADLIIWLAQYPGWNSSAVNGRRRLFLLELGNELIKPQIQRRALVPQLKVPVRLAMKMVGIGSTPKTRAENQCVHGKHKRCALCPRESNKKARVVCGTCDRNVCAAHSVQLIVCND